MKLKVVTEWPNGVNVEFVDLPPEWESWSEAKRENWSDDAASNVFFNLCNYGHSVSEDEEDFD